MKVHLIQNENGVTISNYPIQENNALSKEVEISEEDYTKSLLPEWKVAKYEDGQLVFAENTSFLNSRVEEEASQQALQDLKKKLDENTYTNEDLASALKLLIK